MDETSEYTRKLFDASQDLCSMAAELSSMTNFKPNGLLLNEEMTGVFETQRIESLAAVAAARESLARASRSLAGLAVCHWLKDKADAEDAK
jgi:hypothetical protein